MLVNMSGLLSEAQRSGYAVGSFSVANMEMVIGVLKAAQETRSPVILQIAQVRLNHSPLEMIGPLMVAAAEQSQLPVAVHFDHGKTLDKIELALDLGFSSVMLDGSHLPFEENLLLTQKAAALAAGYGADTEGEIGCVGGSEDGSEQIAVNYTEPQCAERFARLSGIQALAVAIGNAHGNYKCEPELRFDVLEDIRSRTDVPLVLHGGTGISAKDFRRCIELGVCKINIATATFDSVERRVSESYSRGEIGGYYDLHGAQIEGAYLNALKHMEIFGCAGKI